MKFFTDFLGFRLLDVRRRGILLVVLLGSKFSFIKSFFIIKNKGLKSFLYVMRVSRLFRRVGIDFCFVLFLGDWRWGDRF